VSHNEEFHPLYCLLNTRTIKSRRIRWARHVTRMMEVRNAHKVSAEKSEAMRPLGRIRNEDIIKAYHT
jgi:hypothetical protein